ncbi:TetR family transcriptional regulator C-terminal domain-containing protein [Nonomuraea sp. NPDC049152]|uniref:TetR/AcrR family transcriptional regulator n=1 Tax=Nonomuraea sp. NPDC049152 TaxID=3154350 RepID=UPI0033F4AB66
MDRGEQRRERLIEAGLALLSESGWPAVTTRAVAERADTNLGLIHYHFGGLKELHVAIARRAGEMVIEPLLAQLLATTDERAGVESLRSLLPVAAGDDHITRLSVELVAGALRTPEIGEVLRDQLRVARGRIAEWLRALHPQWPPSRCLGAATLITALLDGLVLHRLLDPELPAREAVAALTDLVDQLEGGAE